MAAHRMAITLCAFLILLLAVWKCNAEKETVTCMSKILEAVKIKPALARQYETTFASLHYTVATLKSTRTIVLSFLMRSNYPHALALKRCLVGRLPACKKLQVCSAGGQCILSRKKYKCKCAEGKFGQFCTKEKNECDSNPCQNGGRCTDGLNKFTCKCAVGYEGVVCAKQWLQARHHKPLPWAMRQVKAEVAGIRSKISTWRLYAGGAPVRPMASCYEIKKRHPTARTGFYTLKTSEGLQRVFCEMQRSGGGWTRIADILPSHQQQCPGGMVLDNAVGGGVCRRSGGGAKCVLAKFSPLGIRYKEIMGFVDGYQYYTNDGFSPPAHPISSYYVDGVSITKGKPYQHVWTYAMSHTTVVRAYSCPCSKNAGPSPPAFVGSNYYCTDVDNPHHRHVKWYRTFSQGCPAGSKCCKNPNQPWFTRRFSATNDGVQIRICSDQGNGNEDTGISKAAIFIR